MSSGRSRLPNLLAAIELVVRIEHARHWPEARGVIRGLINFLLLLGFAASAPVWLLSLFLLVLRADPEPVVGARSRRPGRRLDADLLSQREIESLLRCCSNRAPTGIRNRALIALAWRSGLRIGEVLALREKDLDLEQGVLVIQHGKGDRRRVVGIDAGSGALVARWLQVRRKLGIPRTRPVFCTLRGRGLDQSYVRHLLPRLARRAGVAKRVHAHALRHSFAIELEREGAPLSSIRDLLGHNSAATTDRYLRRVGGGEAIEFQRRRAWSLAKDEAATRLEEGDRVARQVGQARAAL